MRYPALDIDLLRCFTAVADQGGFTAAGHFAPHHPAACSATGRSALVGFIRESLAATVALRPAA